MVSFLLGPQSLANPPQDAINVAPKLIVCAVVGNNDTNQIDSFAVPFKRQRRPPRGKAKIVGILPRITFTVGVYAFASFCTLRNLARACTHKLSLPDAACSTSDLHPIAPNSGHCGRSEMYLMHHSKQRLYSITSSARTSNEGGTVRPSALAVFMLITSSNLVGCSTGRSEGLVPLSILST